MAETASDAVHVFVCPKCDRAVAVFTSNCTVTCSCGRRMARRTMSKAEYRAFQKARAKGKQQASVRRRSSSNSK